MNGEIEHICARLFDIAAELYDKVGDPEMRRLYKAVNEAAEILDAALPK